jgi:hypothetical protein
MWNTIKHLLILLAVIATLATAVVMTVNNNSVIGFEPSFGEGQHQFTSVQQPGDRPAFQGAPRERDGGSSFGGLELLKNLGIIAIISAVIIFVEKAWSWIRRFRKSAVSVS